MTDVDPAHPVTGGDGDGPDTFDDRLADLARLLDTIGDELDDTRRLRRRAVVVRLLALTLADAVTRVAALAERVDD